MFESLHAAQEYLFFGGLFTVFLFVYLIYTPSK